MTPNWKRALAAFSRVELLVVAAIVALLASMLLPALAQSQQKSQRLMCANNLKFLGVAYRVWFEGHEGYEPALQRVAQGGWEDLSGGGLEGPGSANYAGAATFTNYEVMQNVLGQCPRTVLCPADDRVANTNFYDHLWAAQPGSFNNTNCSYWVGPGASVNYPRSLLGGDRNLGGGATINANGNQDPNYGFSPPAGSTGGEDVQLTTNGQVCSASGSGSGGQGTYCQWSTKLHSAGNPAGAGNILLGDCSVQQVTSSSFKTNFLKKATDLGNYGPAGACQFNCVRLLFP